VQIVGASPLRCVVIRIAVACAFSSAISLCVPGHIALANDGSAIRFIFFVASSAPFNQGCARAKKKHEPNKVARKAQSVRG
jgi:hypothetical protein